MLSAFAPRRRGLLFAASPPGVRFEITLASCLLMTQEVMRECTDRWP
jgi:hypothetical protein